MQAFDWSGNDGATKMKMGGIYRQFVFLSFLTLLIPVDSNATFTEICRDVRLPADAFPLGTSFAFTCPCINCDDMVIEKAGSPSQWLSEHITRKQDSITLNVVLSSTEMAGTYQCCHKHCSSASRVWKYRTIRVGTKPGPAELEGCYAEGLDYLICSWHHNVTSPGDFPPRYWGYFANSHEKDVGHNKLKWRDASLKDEKSQFEVEIPGNVHQAFYVKLCARNTFGCTCNVFPLGTLYAIMKPKRPKNLEAVSKDSTELALSWKTPEDLMYQIDPVVYRVDWSQGDLEFLHGKKKSNVTVPNKTNMLLQGLRPFTLYQVTVHARLYSYESNSETGFWGISSNVSFTTARDVPQSAPGIKAGMYHKVACQQNAKLLCIRIYWRPIPKSDWGAKEIQYSLVITETNKKQTIQNTSNVASTESKFEYETKLPGSSLRIHLRAFNEMGYSNGPYLNIPHSSGYQPSNVDGATLNASRQQVSWEGDDNLRYTVFYCKKGITDDCMEGEDGTLNAIEISNKEKKVEIVLKEPVPHKYGVSASYCDNVSRQTLSGGIVWLDDMEKHIRHGGVKTETKTKRDDSLLIGILGALGFIGLVAGTAVGCVKWRSLKRTANILVPNPDVEDLIPVPRTGEDTKRNRSLPPTPNDVDDNASASLIIQSSAEAGSYGQFGVTGGATSSTTPLSGFGSGITQSSKLSYANQIGFEATGSGISDEVNRDGTEGQTEQKMYGELDHSDGINSSSTTSPTAQSRISDARAVIHIGAEGETEVQFCGQGNVKDGSDSFNTISTAAQAGTIGVSSVTPNGPEGQTEPECYGQFEVSHGSNSFSTTPNAAPSGSRDDSSVTANDPEGPTEPAFDGPMDLSDGTNSFGATPSSSHPRLSSGSIQSQAGPTGVEFGTFDVCADVHDAPGDYGAVGLDETGDSGLIVTGYSGDCIVMTSVDCFCDCTQTQQPPGTEHIELQSLRRQ